MVVRFTKLGIVSSKVVLFAFSSRFDICSFRGFIVLSERRMESRKVFRRMRFSFILRYCAFIFVLVRGVRGIDIWF